jgi:uncharacterized protein (TIGR00251 family)
MHEASVRIREAQSGVSVPLHVQPRARRTQIAGTHGDALKIQVSAPPAEDAANRAVVDFFARLLRLPKARLQIIAGQKSRDKILRIEGITANELRKRIGFLEEDPRADAPVERHYQK